MDMVTLGRRMIKPHFQKHFLYFFGLFSLPHFLCWLNEQSNEMKARQQLIIIAKLLNSPHPKMSVEPLMKTSQQY